MKKQKIEDIFSSMEDFSSVPPPELWAGIEEKLDKPKKKKRAILWWSAAACLLLCLSLPMVLSNSGNKIDTGNAVEKNNVVLDENKNNKNHKNATSKENQNSETNTNRIINPDSENISNSASNSDANSVEKNAVANVDSKTENSSKSGVSKSNVINNSTQIVAEETAKNEKKNQFSVSGNQKQSQAVAVKNYDSGTQNAFNPSDKNQFSASGNQKSNQAVAVKNYDSGKQNSFNSSNKNQFSASGNQNLNAEKKNSNQALAEKNYSAQKQNAFNTANKNQFSENEKRNLDKVLAEKTFTGKNANSFTTNSKNQLPNSVFENNVNSNKNNVAFNSVKTTESNKQNSVSANKTETIIKDQKSEKAIATNTQKSNSKFNDALSKKDSVQLAELQNLEKGIITPEVKNEKKKDPKTTNAEKWALEVFAGVANSENYKNDKTLGNVNDSKQSNSFGVKTKYKLNKKWAVGSGFKINELGQSVANVSYISTKNNAFLGTSDYFIQNATVPQIATNDSYVLVSNTTKNAVNSNNIQSGKLDQSLKYIEMPLEVSYAVFSKNKASISLNTGGFVGKLIANNIALDGNSIGENVNANDFVYGSTLSSTVQYRVYKKTNVFVEPAMNYYINPLSSQSFNQFQWGLNFGLNVSF
ncbi:hypothetical protein [Flavobacterium sp. KACC 22761]|uniref:hypothetical protein n=1 Tax=Flavobacterium sp. KACC 22761 TaxID=3092665 RepID=UPI002A757931|nr:hypothetical protein [Flavobacterium sp. KACC 22761]WPO79236.1 hypothetical protein SCB73_02400 [Flavobacterium sp. KACC 22761]